MLRDLFSSIGGIGHYGVISTVIFVVFFVLLTLYALTLKKQKVEDYSHMPLGDNSNETEDNQDIK